MVIPQTGRIQSVIKSDDSNLSDVIEVSAGNFISMFLCADGTVWVSGNGYGTKATQLLNQDGSGVTGVTDIFAGEIYIQFRKADGTVRLKGGMRDVSARGIQSP